MHARLLSACLVLTLLGSACSGSSDADSDILAEWRSNNPDVSTTAPSTTVSPLPELPEGIDPTLAENYPLAAMRNYMIVRQAAADLIMVASEFDLGSTTWIEELQGHIAEVRKSIEEFQTLNPPAEFAEQHQKLIESMGNIVGLTENFEEAISELDFRKGADTLTSLQAETNVLVSHGRFPEIKADGVPTEDTTTSLP